MMLTGENYRGIPENSNALRTSENDSEDIRIRVPVSLCMIGLAVWHSAAHANHAQFFAAVLK